MLRFSPRALAAGSLLLVLALVPLYAQWQGEPFLLALFGRVLVYGIAALALNLLLGYGGMVSFGHALYLGLGAYAVGVLSHHGIENGWLHLAAALGACALVGLVSGYVALRTSGIAFIMITLASRRCSISWPPGWKATAATTACRCSPAATSACSGSTRRWRCTTRRSACCCWRWPRCTG